jgi:hypothetical protein
MMKKSLKCCQVFMNRAVKRYFMRTTQDDAREQEWLEFLRQNLAMKNMQKLYLEIIENRMLRVIIRSEVNSLMDDHKKVFLDRYQQQKNYVQISQAAYISISQAYAWNTAVLNDIISLFFYQLPRRNYFNKTFIVMLIDILSEHIACFSNFDETFLDRQYLKNLERKKQLYEKVLDTHEKILQHVSPDCARTLSLFVAYPSITIADAADRLNCTSAQIAKHRGKLINEIKNVLERTEHSG